MVEIIKIYRQNVDALKFVGKKYDNANRADGTFKVKLKWDEWFENGWFEVIENVISGNPNDTCVDGGAYIGLTRNECGKPFQYWIGMFVPVNTETPEGFDYINFPKSELGVCWVYGKDEDVYMMNEGIGIIEQCNARLKREGMHHVHDKDDVCWAFERYACPRFTTPDEKGNIILDICLFMNLH